MTWSVIWARRAVRDMGRLDRQLAERVRAAVRDLAATGRGDVVHLKGSSPPERRLRVGDWRVRFQVDQERRSIEVIRVLPRGRAYRD